MENEKQRERLVELLLKCDKESEVLDCFNGRPTKKQSADIIAEYLLANNVVVLPLKVGDVVYQLAHGYAEEETVRCPYLQYLTNGYSFTEEDIGKTVFIGENAKAEAEAKLREMQNEK